jgi:GntR family transcriptional repressor for pyruvate dehydrogenase complex
VFKEVKNQRLYLQIVNQIRHLIAKGNLKAGDKLLPERELTEKFGVSRASIREAMSALEILGLIESRGSQGNFIKADKIDASIDSELLKELLKNHSPLEVFEARCELEPSLTALAAKKRTLEDLKELKEHLQKLNSLGHQIEFGLKNLKKVEDYMEEDRIFHLAIAHCANNSILFAIYSRVNSMLKEKHWKVLKMKSIAKKGKIKKFEKEHTGMFNAIREGNTELARINALDHLQYIKRDMFDK